MLINPFVNTGSLSAFNTAGGGAAVAAPAKAQVYQAQTRQAVQAPEESSNSRTDSSSYGKKGVVLTEARGQNIDILV